MAIILYSSLKDKDGNMIPDWDSVLIVYIIGILLGLLICGISWIVFPPKQPMCQKKPHSCVHVITRGKTHQIGRFMIIDAKDSIVNTTKSK